MIDSLPQSLFYVVMVLAIMGWLSLILFPRRPWANFWFAGLVIPFLLCLIYMYLLLTFWFREPAATFSQFFTLEGIYAMFANRGLLLVGWINLIAMDLVVGAWMARKAAQIRMPYVYLLPCLVVAFIFAGFGFTLFAILAAMGAGWTEISKFEQQPPTNAQPAMARPMSGTSQAG